MAYTESTIPLEIIDYDGRVLDRVNWTSIKDR